MARHRMRARRQRYERLKRRFTFDWWPTLNVTTGSLVPTVTWRVL